MLSYLQTQLKLYLPHSLWRYLRGLWFIVWIEIPRNVQYAFTPGKFDFSAVSCPRRSYHNKFVDEINTQDAFVAKFIQAESKVLDLGCGTGNLMAYLQEIKKIDGVGLERYEGKVNIARDHHVKAFVCDLDNLNDENLTRLLEEEWDWVVSVWSMMYWTYPEEIIKQLAEKTKYQMHAVSNAGYWPRRLRLLWGYFPYAAYQDQDDDLVLNLDKTKRWWSVADFISWGNALGFEVIPVGARLGLWSVSLFPGYKLFASSVFYVFYRKENQGYDDFSSTKRWGAILSWIGLTGFLALLTLLFSLIKRIRLTTMIRREYNR